MILIAQSNTPCKQIQQLSRLKTLDILMTFIYELYEYSLKISRVTKYELSTSRLSKVGVAE